MTGLPIPWWCVVSFATNPPQYLCQRCKATKPMPLPIHIDQMAILSSQFGDEHRECQPVAGATP